MKCTKCGSTNVVHKDHEMKELTHTSMHLGGHQLGHALKGHPTMFLVVAGLWAANKVAHRFAKPWTCKDCQHSF